MHDSILVRSSSRNEQKKLGYGSFFCCLLVVFCFCSLLIPYLGPLPALNFQASMGVNDGLKMLARKEMNNSQQIFGGNQDLGMSSNGSTNVSLQVESSTSPRYTTTDSIANNAAEEINVTKKMQPICNTGELKTEFCEIKMEVWIDGNSSSVFTVSSQTGSTSSWRIKPYSRKQDPAAMGKVKSWSVKSVLSNQEIPKCTKVHNVPAVLFSLPRFVGNIFHDFTEVLIPLYITSQQYNGEVQFLASEKPQWWIEKFQEVLKGLTKYEIMDIDKEIEEVHCFPSATIGLKRDTREFIIDPLKHSSSMRDFRVLIRNGYSLKRSKAIKLRDEQQKKPRILIISRRRTRAFMNIEEISKMAKSFGFEVIVTEADKNLKKFAELVNSCDVFMGVHGAGLTNMVFLPENAIVIQIVPYGLFQWIAAIDYGDPEKDMSIKYLQYDCGENESTLIKKYPLDHAVFTDPYSFWEQGWDAYRAVYLDQNVNLNVNKFRLTLLKAFDLLRDDQ